MERARQCKLLAGACPCELRGGARQSELLAGARPCELMGGARQSELLSGGSPCELREELVSVNRWQELVHVN